MVIKKVSTLLGVIAITLLLPLSSTVKAKVYIYDNLNRMTEVWYPTGEKVKYTYDATGNITSTAKSTLQSLAMDYGTYTLTLHNSHNSIVMGIYSDGEAVDVTRDVTFKSSDANVVTISDDGIFTSQNDGTANVTAQYAGMIYFQLLQLITTI